MAVLSALKSAQADLIRKPLDAAVLIAPTSATIPTAWTTSSTADLIALPTGFKGLGYVTKDDGLTFSRDISVEETTSYGSVTPTRRDMVSDTTTVGFTCQETNLQTLQLYFGVDLSAATATATTGELGFSQPLQPSSLEVPAGHDRAGRGRHRHRLRHPDLPGGAAVRGRRADLVGFLAELSYPLTFTATPDNTAGYAARVVFGGPGGSRDLFRWDFPLPPDL
jgi:hypothetical protein